MTESPETRNLALQDLYEPPVDADTSRGPDSTGFRRERHVLPDAAEIVLDSFPDAGAASCSFLRLPAGPARNLRLEARDIDRIESCPSGGWLLRPDDAQSPSYWIPHLPMARVLDAKQRILSEHDARPGGFELAAGQVSVTVEVPEDACMDLAVWRIPASDSGITAALEKPLVIETQPLSLWNSQTGYSVAADIYRYLVHGHVYVDRFIWPRMWKICSELDAYGLYNIMTGLEQATGKAIYSLLKRQLVVSVIDRQAADGGWHHGEWTDRMESHYRFHNGAMLLLQAAMMEQPDDVVGKSLERAAGFLSQCTDSTSLGLWFLHDSLEDHPDMMRELCEQTGSTWIPARTLGKSPTNKLILNTHVDAIVVLEQYRGVTGDDRYAAQVESARTAARDMLALHPAESFYRIMYRAIRLTLLPASEAARLPLPVRAVKRLTWKYLTPRMHSIKRRFPRLVMPGGLIERHLGMPHYDINYHPVNMLDLARLWRCFPAEDLAGLLDGAIGAVTDSSLLKYWAEAKKRHFSLLVWVEALYHLHTLKQDPEYRRILAEGVMELLDAGLGLPPCLLGGDTEAVKPAVRVSCPSPVNSRLRVVNLGSGERTEILVINHTKTDLKVTWENPVIPPLSWESPDGQPVHGDVSIPTVAAHNWIRGTA